MSDHIASIKHWVASFREDVEAVKAVVTSDAIDPEARKYAAAGLNYLVTRIDLIPDWTETIGVMDDVMVLRICLDLAGAGRLTEHLSGEALIAVGRMSNDIGPMQAYLGDDLYAKLRKHCTRLVDTAVRGRSPEAIVDDEDMRAALWAEIDEELRRMPAATFEDTEDVTVKLKAYLAHKLA